MLTFLELAHMVDATQYYGWVVVVGMVVYLCHGASGPIFSVLPRCSQAASRDT